ncbi:glycoside hydrolase family 95 protein [Verrucomicrobiaceae bacterium N1E253]|uniref:Glycoside hydrolase family 95 protein n=1 Tax=Oceaniferula marina TaxID=2748318 RepID=A0A851G9S4_9BACT|nr:glycoside hydrolase family 95 protein [Oceaniferula marina]NWK54468.1 glycoside hydrolase family 95 protein [Oceaniferula marina]
MSLWFDTPASQWEQGLPMGNGRLGMLVHGDIGKETIVFNEDSLWSGWFEPANDREGAYRALQLTRQLIKQGARQDEIKKAAMEFCSLHGYGKADFGAYQSFCSVTVSSGHEQKDVSNYHRRLDLKSAVSKVTYEHDGVRYEREFFSSYPAQVNVMRYRASRSGALDLNLNLHSLHKKAKITVDSDGLVIRGEVDNGKNKPEGMKFEGRLRVKVRGGRLTSGESNLQISGADEVLVIMTGATNYQLDYASQYRGASPELKNIEVLKQLKNKSFSVLKQEHTLDYQALFKRVRLHLAGTDRSDMPTDQRRQLYRESKDDVGLENLTFQYGRYLMIACSRPGSMPANLQGLWNHSNSPPWTCDYHLNINFQMNYWPVDLCNLSECAEPMVRWTTDLMKPGKKTAAVHYQSPGWVAHHTTNVWGFTSPGPARGIHMLEAESSAFLCQNIWDHYAFTGDIKYLRERAWPLLKGSADFWLVNLQENADGSLSVSPSYSPEWGPLSDGSYYQTMILWDLFEHCIKVSSILGVDEQWATELKLKQARLQPLKIGKYGQLHEWRQDQYEEGIDKKKHRHMSHLWSVYPGHQIVPGRDADLTKAAIRSLNLRGDGATGWSMGWKINLWARLLDGNRTHKLIGNFIGSRVYDNLWCAHPPFQIDGNFGYTAGVAEMLVQSHAGQINLLPALPDVWHTGEVSGLKARTGIELSIAWKNGSLRNVELLSSIKQSVPLTYKGKRVQVDLPKGKKIHLDSHLNVSSSDSSQLR